MIREVHGDVFNQGADIVAHQVNCKGVMGAGIAVTVKKMLGPILFKEYQHLCKREGSQLLGTNLYSLIRPNGKKLVIANCFAQDGCGTGLQTDYDALRTCLEKVKEHAEYLREYRQRPITIAIPGLMGCGLAGGDWDYIKNEIIIPIFKDIDILLTIAYFEEEAYVKYSSYIGE